MVITSITQAKKSESRVNIFLDEKFWVGLDKNDLLAFGLHKGKEISEEEKKEIEKASNYGKLRNRAINYIMIRPRSRKELRDYLLFKREADGEEANKLLDELEKKTYLNDDNFAKWYIDAKTGSKANGPNKIKAELIKKGVDRKIIDTAIAEKFSTDEVQEQEYEKLLQLAQKVLPKIKHKTKMELKSKLIARLMGRGYQYSEIEKVIKESNI